LAIHRGSLSLRRRGTATGARGGRRPVRGGRRRVWHRADRGARRGVRAAVRGASHRPGPEADPRSPVLGNRGRARNPRRGREDALRARVGCAARGAGTRGGGTMTIRDPEVVETLRNEPELLAIADALQSAGDRIEAPTPSRRARPRWLRPAAAALAFAAVLGVVLASPWDSGSGPSLVERARAAVGDEPVDHVVLQTAI